MDDPRLHSGGLRAPGNDASTSGSWLGKRHARGLWTKSWSASAPIASARSGAAFTPPPTWPPKSTRLR